MSAPRDGPRQRVGELRTMLERTVTAPPLTATVARPPVRRAADPCPPAPARHFVSLGEHLRRPRSRLARFAREVHRLIQVGEVFRGLLPPPLQDHARLGSMGTEAWVVRVDSSVWATRLRYGLQGLQAQLQRRLGTPVPPLRIRIDPPRRAPATPAPRPAPRLGDGAARSMEAAARSVGDGELGAALRRLARHARPSVED